ncbi:MAG: phosphoribosylanthranilate isomerase [Pseudomonadota bacterium]
MASIYEVAMAAQAGVHMVGLVGPMPTGPGTLSLEVAADLAESAPATVTTVFLSASPDAEGLSQDLYAVRPHVVQIVRHVAPSVHRDLAETWPAVQRLQVIHVEGPEAVDLIKDYGDGPDAFLLDSGRLAADELGGTGRVHDWSISRACVEATTKPVFLAGGLTPENVGAAIAAVRPAGIDVCSGVRSDGKLDAGKLLAFIAAITEAS